MTATIFLHDQATRATGGRGQGLFLDVILSEDNAWLLLELLRGVCVTRLRNVPLFTAGVRSVAGSLLDSIGVDVRHGLDETTLDALLNDVILPSLSCCPGGEHQEAITACVQGLVSQCIGGVGRSSNSSAAQRAVTLGALHVLVAVSVAPPLSASSVNSLLEDTAWAVHPSAADGVGNDATFPGAGGASDTVGTTGGDSGGGGGGGGETKSAGGERATLEAWAKKEEGARQRKKEERKKKKKKNQQTPKKEAGKTKEKGAGKGGSGASDGRPGEGAPLIKSYRRGEPVFYKGNRGVVMKVHMNPHALEDVESYTVRYAPPVIATALVEGDGAREANVLHGSSHIKPIWASQPKQDSEDGSDVDDNDDTTDDEGKNNGGGGGVGEDEELRLALALSMQEKGLFDDDDGGFDEDERGNDGTPSAALAALVVEDAALRVAAGVADGEDSGALGEDGARVRASRGALLDAALSAVLSGHEEGSGAERAASPSVSLQDAWEGHSRASAVLPIMAGAACGFIRLNGFATDAAAIGLNDCRQKLADVCDRCCETARVGWEGAQTSGEVGGAAGVTAIAPLLPGSTMAAIHVLCVKADLEERLGLGVLGVRCGKGGGEKKDQGNGDKDGDGFIPLLNVAVPILASGGSGAWVDQGGTASEGADVMDLEVRCAARAAVLRLSRAALQTGAAGASYSQGDLERLVRVSIDGAVALSRHVLPLSSHGQAAGGERKEARGEGDEETSGVGEVGGATGVGCGVSTAEAVLDMAAEACRLARLLFEKRSTGHGEAAVSIDPDPSAAAARRGTPRAAWELVDAVTSWLDACHWAPVPVADVAGAMGTIEDGGAGYSGYSGYSRYSGFSQFRAVGAAVAGVKAALCVLPVALPSSMGDDAAWWGDAGRSDRIHRLVQAPSPDVQRLGFLFSRARIIMRDDLAGGRGGVGVGAGSSVEGVDAAGAAAVEEALLRVRGEVEESFEINHADMLSEAEEETARVQRVRSEYVEESPRRKKRAMGCGGGRGQLEGDRGLQRGLQRETENGGERLTET
jgi:hypothetical protein